MRSERFLSDYLHDKRKEGELERLTTERVAWTYAVNTLENEPERVLAEMRRTCFDQQYLKMLSGNRVDGSRTQKSPDEPAPSKQQMIEGGHSYLQHMGWEAHQALFLCHTDTIRDEVRAEFAPEWQVYARHRDERHKAAQGCGGSIPPPSAR